MSTLESTSKNPLKFIVDFVHSSIGSKVLMALTGFVLWGFVLQHMVMNLQMLMPPPEGGYWGQQLNEYAHNLKSMTGLIWGGRAFLLGTFVLHIYLGIRLARLSKAARPQAYAQVTSWRATLASKTMALSGILLLAFVVFHVLHYTIGVIDPGVLAFRDQENMHDVYRMVRVGFSNPAWVAIYIIGNLVVLSHLYHGSVSFLQSLGLRHKRWTPIISLGGRLVVFAILVGNLTMVLVVFSWQYRAGG